MGHLFRELVLLWIYDDSLVYRIRDFCSVVYVFAILKQKLEKFFSFTDLRLSPNIWQKESYKEELIEFCVQILLV